MTERTFGKAANRSFILQSFIPGRVDGLPENTMPSLRFHRTVDAPASLVWDVITDHELYAAAAPNLETVELLDGEGETLTRRCVDTDGNAWTESCTRWEPGRRFAVAVDVEDSEFHRRLFSRFEGEWGLVETPAGVEITIAFDFEPRYGPLGRLITWYFDAKAPALIEAIFDRWETEIAARQAPAEAGSDRPSEASPSRGTNALYP